MSGKSTNTEIKVLLSQLRSAAEVIKAHIHEVDQKIAALMSERQSLSEAQLTKADFMHYARKDIERRTAGYPNRMKNLARKTGFPFNISFPQLERIDKSGGSQSFPYLDGEGYSDGSVLNPCAMYWIFGDLIEKRFSDALDQFDWPENGLSPDERRKRIHEIEQKLEELNSQRDSLASDLISTGMTQ